MSIAVWSPQAARDVEEILYYIRVTSGRPLTTRRIGEEFIEAAKHRTDLASSGFRYPAAPPEWRYIRHKRWLIFYQPHPHGIEVMRVVDATRDLPRVLSELPDQL
jgi:plasmid stabilization system protein ParE